MTAHVLSPHRRLVVLAGAAVSTGPGALPRLTRPPGWPPAWRVEEAASGPWRELYPERWRQWVAHRRAQLAPLHEAPPPPFWQVLAAAPPGAIGGVGTLAEELPWRAIRRLPWPVWLLAGDCFAPAPEAVQKSAADGAHPAGGPWPKAWQMALTTATHLVLVGNDLPPTVVARAQSLLPAGAAAHRLASAAALGEWLATSVALLALPPAPAAPL